MSSPHRGFTIVAVVFHAYPDSHQALGRAHFLLLLSNEVPEAVDSRRGGTAREADSQFETRVPSCDSK